MPDDRDHLKAIIDLAEDAVYIKDLKRRYLLVNPMAVKFLGRPAGELLGKTDEQVFGAALSREVAAFDRAVIRTKKPVSYERRGQSAGKERVFLTTKVPYRDRNGKLRGVIGISREITARKLMEEELAASESKHRLLLNSIQSPVLALDNDLTIIYCNKAYAAFVNKSVAGLEGRNLLKAFPRIRATKTYQAYRKVLETGRSQTVEGKMGDRYLSAQVFRTPAGLLAITEDVTARQLAQQELERAHKELEVRVQQRTVSLTKSNLALQKESQQRLRSERTLRDRENEFRTILENSLDVITILNEDGIIKYANPSLTTVLGHDHNGMLGKSVFDYLHPSDTPRAIKVLSELQQQSGAAQTVELRLRHSDGGWRLLEISGKYVARTQELGGIVINARDVTQGRQAMDEIRESEERQRVLFDVAPDAYFLCDFKGSLIDCNQAFLRLTGRGKPEITGRNPWELGLIPIDRAPELIALLSQNATGREAGPEEFVIAPRNAGPVNVEITTHPLKIKHQPLVLGIITDVTETKYQRDREKEYYQGLEFLSRTAMELVKMKADQDLFAYIGERLSEFCGNAIVGVSAANAASDSFRIKAVAGLGALQPVVHKMLGFELAGKSFSELPPDIVTSMSAARLDRIGGGIHELLLRKVPAALCREIEKRATITEVYAMGFVANGRLIGSVAILLREGRRLGNTAVVETFINQAAVAIEHWLDEQRLRRDIVERQQSLQALKHSEEFARAIVEHSPLGVAVRDAAGQLISCNQAWKRIWGISDETVIRDIIKHRPDLAMENDETILAGWRPAVQRIYAKGGALHIPEVQLSSRHPAGSRWAALYFYALKDQQGAVERVIIVTEDISERRKAEQQLRRNEQLFRALIEHSSDVVSIINQDGMIRYQSPSVQRELGYAPDELVGTSVFDLVHPDDAPRVLQAFAQFLQNPGQVATLDYRFKHKDGSWVALSAVGQNLLRDPLVSGIVINSRNITENKRAGQALRESEERYRSLIETAPDAIVVHREGKVLFANPACLRMLGVDGPMAVVGKNLLDFVHPDFRQLVISRVRSMTEEGKSAPLIEEKFLRPDGTAIDVEVAAGPVIWEGAPAVQVVFRDITERKQAEAALRDSELRYRTFFETAAEGIFRSTPDGRVLLANPALVQMLGYGSVEELLQRNITSEGYFDPAVRDEFKRRIGQDGQVRNFVNTWRRVDGSQLVVSENARAVRDGSGRIEYYEGTVEDITDRMRAERALQDSEQRYRALTETSPDMIFTVDHGGFVRYINSTATRYLGREPAEVAGRPMQELFPEEIAARQWRNMQSVLSTGQPLYLQNQSMFQGQPFWLDTWLVPLKNERGGIDAVMGISRDITERKRVEQSLQQSEERFRALSDSLPETVFEFDRNRRFIYINRTGFEKYGYGPADLEAGLYAEQTIAPEERADAISRIMDRLQGGQPVRTEFTAVRKDGTRFPVQIYARPLLVNGTVAGLRGIVIDLSQLRLADLQHRATLDAMADMIHVVDRDLRLLFFNEAFRAMNARLGLTTDVIGKPLTDVFPFLPTTVIEEYHRTFAGGGALVTEESTEVAGRVFFTETRKIPVIEDGQVVRVVTAVRDVTERKAAEQALRESELRYRMLIENLDEVIFSVDAAGVMTYISPRIESMIGYRPEEVIGANFAQFIHPDDLPGLQASFTRTLAGALEPYEFRVIRKGGGFRYLQSSSRPTGGPGNPTGLNGVLTDITERKRTADALRESEQRYRSLVENMADGVYRSSADGRFLDVNPAMVRIFGYGSREELLAADIKRDLYFATGDRWRDYPQDGMVRTRALRMKRKDGSEIWVEDNCRYIRGADGEVEVHEGVLRDITDRKADEEKIKYLTFHDRLTGLHNRAYYEEVVASYDTPEHSPLSLIMGDANGLKLVNDAFGHEAGDQFLRRIAEIIKGCARPQDLIFRWGGDEFVVLMPRTDNATAREICDAINQACSLADEDPIRPSIALGSGTKADAGQSVNAVMMEAEDRMYRHKLVESKSLRSSIISSLGRTLWEADYETEEHALRLQQLAMEFGRALKLTDSELNDLLMLAALHDIGKIAIADGILLKPSGLTDEEWEIVRKHPEIGFRIAQSSPELAPIADGILAHHERWDGAGYPQGLRGEQIPIVARILAVIDAYDVMTQKRLYKQPISRESAIAELQKCAGSQFDPALVDLFVKIITRKQP